MKILTVVHYFLPTHQAGTEIYAANLAKALAGAGHEVSVFTSEDGEPSGGRFELRDDEWEGLPVYRLIRGEPPDFERSYLDPEVDAIFRELLQKIQPDVVHFQHTFRLSCGMIPVCKDAGVPAVLTLADFWHICPPILLLKPGFERCPGPDPEGCARCGNAIGALYSGAPGSGLAQSDNKLLREGGKLVQAGADRAVRAAHAVKRKLPRSLVDKAREIKQRREIEDPGSNHQRRRAMIEARMEAMRDALSAACLVIAPSNFLRDKMIEAGAVEPDKIIHSDYGFDKAPFEKIERTESRRLRFGFIGTPVEHKGVHVAVLAMNLLADLDAEFMVHGEPSWFPAYAKRLKRLAKNPRTRFMGRFDNRDVGRTLAGIDALIVPSLWYENSPLTIHEAFLAGTPVLVSDVGGMAELVAEGGGMTFKVGDHTDLARVIRELVDDPSKIKRLRDGIPPVKSIEENADEMVKIYMQCMESR